MGTGDFGIEMFLKGLKACLPGSHGNGMFEIAIVILDEVRELLERKKTTLKEVKQDIHSIC